MPAFVPRPLLVAQTPTGLAAVVVAQGPLQGGFITNSPANTANLLIDMTGPGSTSINGSGTTVAIAPGQTFYIPPLNGNVSVFVRASIGTAMGIIGEQW